MKREKRRPALAGLLYPLIILAVVLCFFTGLDTLERDQGRQGAVQLETSIRRGAAAVYAAEGIYPPDVAYLEEHCGLQVDQTRYLVDYEVFASNLMPQITVMEIGA